MLLIQSLEGSTIRIYYGISIALPIQSVDLFTRLIRSTDGHDLALRDLLGCDGSARRRFTILAKNRLGTSDDAG